MIALSPCLVAICALSIWTIEYTAGCGDRQDEVKGHCCDRCPPGKYMVGFCSAHHQTRCSPCEDGHYSNEYTLFDRCEKCRSCEQEYAAKCTPTTNTNCSCRSGFLCANNICSKCEENKCVAGEKVRRTGKSLGNGLIEYLYQCEPSCSDSEYFDVKEEICKLRMQCGLLGLPERFPGNKTHNSVCDGGGRHGNGGIFVHLVVGSILFSLTLIVFLSYACVKNAKKHKPCDEPTCIAAVPSNGSNFHLSKEESGLHLIIQDESQKSHSLGQMDSEKITLF